MGVNPTGNATNGSVAATVPEACQYPNFYRLTEAAGLANLTPQSRIGALLDYTNIRSQFGFAPSPAHFPATSTGLSATETGDRRSIKEIKNATPMTTPPITNGVLP
jgi:hypothetical protein